MYFVGFMQTSANSGSISPSWKSEENQLIILFCIRNHKMSMWFTFIGSKVHRNSKIHFWNDISVSLWNALIKGVMLGAVLIDLRFFNRICFAIDYCIKFIRWCQWCKQPQKGKVCPNWNNRHHVIPRIAPSTHTHRRTGKTWHKCQK